MNPGARSFGILVLAWMGGSVALSAGSVSVYPTRPSSRETVEIYFEEGDWFDSCPPVVQGMEVDGFEITVRLGVDPCGDGMPVMTENPYSASSEVGPLPVGIFGLTVEAPDYLTGEPELTTTSFEVFPPVGCGLVNQPGATLLLPYFEVDVADPAGRNTLFSVGSVDVEPALAHAVLWTNRAVPVLSFDFFLPREGLRSFSVRDLLLGHLPETSPPPEPPEGWYAGCQDPLALPEVDSEALIAVLTGQPHPDDGLCYASPVEDGRLATGYLTIDVVRECSGAELRTPLDDDPAYFLEGGQGLASNDNVLWGDWFLVDPSNDFAQGETLVSLVADAQRFGDCAGAEACPSRIATSFYRRQDNRMPLPRTLRSRFLRGGGFAGQTELILWMENSLFSDAWPVECGAPPFCEIRVDAEVWNQTGSGPTPHSFTTVEHALRLIVGGDSLPVGAKFGSLQVDPLQLDCPDGTLRPPEPPMPIQFWMMPVVSAEGRYSAAMSAVPIEDFCR